jgi:ATP-dependent Clp protease ATP-binding subunit ClpA
MKVNKIGFTEEPKPIIQGDQYLEHIQAEDLMEYGFETEFVGRLPVIGRLKDLGVEGLCKILKNPHGSIVSSKARDFEAYSIELNFDDDALRLIAELADKEKTGARGLVSVMEKILLQFEKKLPSTSIKKLTVSKDVVENGQMVLKKMLVEEALTNFQREFWLSDKIILEFTPEAKNWLYENSTAEVDPAKYLQDAFKDYAYGLKLLNLENFKITLEALKNPKEFLNKLIKKSYQKTRS